MATTASPLPLIDPLRRYDVNTALALLGISRKTFYEDIRDGRIATIKDRKRRFVPGSEIVRRSAVPA
jgi:predicted site-specific integrase-resolvase